MSTHETTDAGRELQKAAWDPVADLMQPFRWIARRAVTLTVDLFGGSCSDAEIDAAFAVMSCPGNAWHTFTLRTVDLARWEAYRADPETPWRLSQATLRLPSWTEQEEARSSELRLFAPEEAPLSLEIVEAKRRMAARFVWPPKAAQGAWPRPNVQVVGVADGD
jgi:hypothetical protein